jgi:penicillin amidase
MLNVTEDKINFSMKDEGKVTMRRLKAVFAIVILTVAFWALQTRHGVLPPLGKLLDPVGGFWRNNASSDVLPKKIDLPGLHGPVSVVWDDRHVPYIFAADEHDLIQTQGYLTARDRLWQMEFIARFAGGRLAEIIGPQGLAQDRFQRRLGMTWGAENFVKGLEGNTAMKAVVEAYAEGVNAYIRTLRRADYPLEYKILDYAPETWTAVHSALLLKYMAWNMTGGESELALTKTREKLGSTETDRLFPFHAPFQDPIIPPGTKWAFKALPASGVPVVVKTAVGLPGQSGLIPADAYADLIGSNDWAVSGAKTKTGYPILCNDPHLQLTLPSIWYEIQLSAPGMNVSGVSLPGAPGIIIGFNEKIAWGVTNAGSDVLDFYAITFKDSKREEYAYDGGWRKTTVRREEIKVRGGRPVIEDVIYAHHGPVPNPDGGADAPAWIPADAAMRWTGHDPSGAIEAFYGLNRAQNYEDFMAAIAKYDCPAQNFVYAGLDGRIAIWHNGKFPLRAKGQGRYLQDGSSPSEEWPGWVPMDQVPHIENPARGFVSSANQSPADAAYPYYLGWNYGTFERGARINEILSAPTLFTPEDMVKMQSDALNMRARAILPRLLELLPKTGLTAEEKARADEFAAWDFVHRSESVEPTVFNRFWIELTAAVWNDDLSEKGKLAATPGAEVTMDLILREPDSPYFDDLTTPETETLGEIVRLSFTRAVSWLTKQLGPFGPRWRWGQAQPVTIGHLGRMPGLGAPPLAVSGGRNIVNAASGSHGPSWRMVVEMGPTVRAWGILPGGASGNPGSRFYDLGGRDWAAGKTYELLFLKSSDERHPRIAGRTEIGGAR